MPGAGFSRAGLDPAGFRSNDAGAKVEGTGATLSRAIDPTRNDYARATAAGASVRFASQTVTSAKVLMALGNRVGSFEWDKALGDPTYDIKRNDGLVPQRALAYARSQLAPLINAGEVELVRVDVEIVGTRWVRTVVWKDLSNGVEQRTTT